MRFFILALFSLLTFNALSQPIDHAWLEGNNVRARINADGRLFCTDTSGAFWVPKNGEKPDERMNVMRAAGLWLGGIDPGGNLLLSAQTYSPDSTDFVAGFRGVPNSGRVWKVTREDIEAHLNDFYDNGVVDNPLPAIFGWPGYGNRFFKYYNGYEVPDTVQYSNFWDANYNGAYEPDSAEYPVPALARGFNFTPPTELVFFAFHNDAPARLTHSGLLPVQVLGEAFVYGCPENVVLDNSVFVSYWWQHEGDERADSTFAALFVDVDLGDPENDYHGTVRPPYDDTYFVYNGDSNDTHWQHTQQPLFVVKSIQGPLDADGSEVGLTGLMPIGGIGAPAKIQMPTQDFEFYNYLTGSWRDGTTLTEGGTGYSGDTLTESAFPGYPDELGAWTERNAGNPPGNRRGLLRYKTGNNLRPTAIKTVSHIFTAIPISISGDERRQLLYFDEDYGRIYEEFYCCIDLIIPSPPFPDHCIRLNVQKPNPPLPLQVWPNPASDYVRVWHKGFKISKVRLVDMLGRQVAEGQPGRDFTEIQIGALRLSPGFYFLEVTNDEHRRVTRKVEVRR